MKSNATFSIDTEVLTKARLQYNNLSREIEQLLREALQLPKKETEEPQKLRRKITILKAALQKHERAEKEKKAKRITL